MTLQEAINNVILYAGLSADKYTSMPMDELAEAFKNYLKGLIFLCEITGKEVPEHIKNMKSKFNG